MWTATDRLTFGSVLSNVGPNMTFIDADQADPLPQNFRFWHGVQSAQKQLVFP